MGAAHCLLSISNICVTSTPAIASKVPYFVALVALLGARAIVVKMALGALRQRSPIRLLSSVHVRIMQISQEIGQNHANTDTRRKRVYKSRGFDSKKGQKSTPCMRTRRSNYPNNSNVTIPRCRRRQVSNIVEPEIRTIVEMAERTMEELLREPTEGYEEAIVLPEINADHFEIKTNLLQLVQANPFYGRESENPHAHINSFKRITSTLRFRNVPNDVIKLMMFPFR
ncbi:hypothetical protein Tco_0970099 [Tanacetum coccineum]